MKVNPQTQTPAAHGRSHVQRDLKHLNRDIRHDIKAELKDLKASGDSDKDQAREIKNLAKDFGDALQTAFHEAGSGNTFDAGALPEGVRQAMIGLTESLRFLREGPLPEPVLDDPADTPEPGTLLNLTA